MAARRRRTQALFVLTLAISGVHFTMLYLNMLFVVFFPLASRLALILHIYVHLARSKRNVTH